jgi:hypothetical protein
MRTLAKRPEQATEIAAYNPADFQRLGNVGIQDMEVPALKLLQGLSPEVKENHALRAGRFYHTILERDLGPVVPKVIVEVVTRSVDLWTPKDVRGQESKLLARAADGENWDRPNQRFEVLLANGLKVEWLTRNNVSSSGLLNWGSSNPNDPNSFPAANLVYTLIMRIIEPTGINNPCIYVPSKMARRQIMKLNSKIDARMNTTPPLKQLFSIEAIEKSGRQPGVSWYEPSFNAAGELPDGELYEQIKAEAHRFAKHYNAIKVVGDDKLDDEVPHAGASNAAF